MTFRTDGSSGSTNLDALGCCDGLVSVLDLVYFHCHYHLTKNFFLKNGGDENLRFGQWEKC